MANQLKNYINNDFVNAVSETLSIFSDFDKKKFLQNSLKISLDDKTNPIIAHVFLKKQKTWQDLELKQRIRLLSHAVHLGLGDDFTRNIPVIRNASEKLHKSGVSSLGLFLFPDYVEVYGLNHWEESMEALEHLTQHSTGEFAIRPFLTSEFDKTLRQMKKWSLSKNYHVRRFSSEGTRPLLPWGKSVPQLKENIHTIEILENLKNDTELYVRKSVANHLNDLSKKFPIESLKLAKSWHGANDNQNWIIKHALRTLLKSSHPGALKLFGYNSNGNGIEILDINFDKKIKEGQNFNFSFTLNIKKTQKVRIEYAMYFLRQNSKYSKKVFMISEKDFEKGKYEFSKKYSFKKITTRKYYKGQHKFTILINGKETAPKVFTLSSM